MLRKIGKQIKHLKKIYIQNFQKFTKILTIFKQNLQKLFKNFIHLGTCFIFLPSTDNL